MFSLFYSSRFFLILVVLAILQSPPLFAQNVKKMVFEREKSSASFTQRHLGYEYSLYDLKIPSLERSKSESASIHNLLIGGWYFWGSADFYILFPFKNHKNQSREFSPGVETAFRWYPIPIAHNKFRPFIGLGLNFNRYRQNSSSPNKSHIGYPIHTGVSLANHAFQIEAGIRYQPNPSFDYFVTSSQQRTFSSGETSFFIALKRVVDSAALVKKRNRAYQRKGMYPFVSLGVSSAWIINGNNSYFKNNRPWIDNDVSANIFPELSLGTHWKNNDSFRQRTLFNIAWRRFDYSLNGHGSDYQLNYQALSFEVAQTLFDYHGFVPFAGLSYNLAEMQVSGDIALTQETSVLGLLFGWDLLPFGSKEHWFLRTNFRWYPTVEASTQSGEKIAFPNTEFNFIQWVYQF